MHFNEKDFIKKGVNAEVLIQYEDLQVCMWLSGKIPAMPNIPL